MAKTPKFANAKVFAWVDKWNKICTPDKIVVVKGTKKEHLAICEMMVKKGHISPCMRSGICGKLVTFAFQKKLQPKTNLTKEGEQ